MLERKQEHDCKTGGSGSNIQKACTTGGTRYIARFGDLDDSCQGVWNELNTEVISKLSKSVIALASFKGGTMVRACSGIVIRYESRITTLLSSASLVRCSHDDSKIDNDLKAGIGGSLIDVDGNFLGMNMCCANLTVFLPRNAILQCLERFGIFRGGNKRKGSKLVRSKNKKINDSAPFDFYPPEFDLFSCGYSLPTKVVSGMKLINSFDTKFPSLYGAKRNVQNDHIEKVSSILSGCVVSVASFNGETRLSVCTGIAIECNLYTSILTSASLVRSSDDENKIDDNLRIEVHLPNKQRAMGKLQHYSLDYNIAVVNVQNSLDLKAAYINHQIQFESHCNVIAVGRLFKSGKFIATCGRLTDEPSKLDCKELSTSNCKISKVGIGGPLVDSDGYFVGMNFYDEEVTPFLPRDIILECLRNFETSTISAENTDRTPNRWPVPKPYWTYPIGGDPTDPADDLSTMMRSIVSPKSENLSGCSV